MPDAGPSAGPVERHVLVARSDDIDNHAAALPGWEQCYSRLSAGAFAGSLAFVSLAGVDVFRETTNLPIRQETMAPEHAVVVGLPLEGSDPSYFHGEPLEPGDLIALSGHVASEFLCLGRMDVGAAVIDRAALRAAGFDLPEGACGRFSTVVKAPKSEALRHWLVSLLADVPACGTCAAEDEGSDAGIGGAAALAVAFGGLAALADALTDRPDEGSLHWQRRYRIAAAARDYVDAHDEDLITVPELARAVGVSVRTLEQCFAETMGVAPAVYLRLMRLNAARRMLQPGGEHRTTVAEAATAWGFWHLGRFAAYYQSLFGETPSATLRRS